jgi:hypothetical protein
MHLCGFVKITQLLEYKQCTTYKLFCTIYYTYNIKFQLTEILFYCDITYCCLAIFKFWVGHFDLFCLVLLTLSDISMEVSIEMHDSQYVPMDTK